MNTLRSQAAVKLARRHADRRSDRLTLLPTRLNISRMELQMVTSGTLPEREVRFTKRAWQLGFKCTRVPDGHGGMTMLFEPDPQKR